MPTAPGTRPHSDQWTILLPEVRNLKSQFCSAQPLLQHLEPICLCLSHPQLREIFSPAACHLHPHPPCISSGTDVAVASRPQSHSGSFLWEGAAKKMLKIGCAEGAWQRYPLHEPPQAPLAGTSEKGKNPFSSFADCLSRVPPPGVPEQTPPLPLHTVWKFTGRNGIIASGLCRGLGLPPLL